MQEINEYIPITIAKAKLLDLVRQLAETGDTVAITKNGMPEAVMLSMEKYEALLETITILADPEIMDQVDNSIKEADQEKLFDLDGGF